MSTGSVSTDSSSCSSIDQRLAEIEEESVKLKALFQGAVSYAPRPAKVPAFKTISPEEQAEADGRSIYVGNVDYNCSDEDLKAHFLNCGSVTRVTIPRDRFKGTPKGFAYVEFGDAASRSRAVAMVDSVLKGRAIKVTEKRTNVRGISSTNRFPGFNKVNRMHGGAISKHVPAYVAAKSIYQRRHQKM